jgi:hypothetical protein
MQELEMGLGVFATWQAAVFALMTYIVTYTARTVIQTLWKGWRESRLYTELFLHLAPMGNGLILALIARGFPWPEEIGKSLSARVMFGTVLGMFCGIFYGRVRAFLSGKKVDEQGNSIPPPPMGDPVIEEIPPESVVELPVSIAPPSQVPLEDEKTVIKPFPKPDGKDS